MAGHHVRLDALAAPADEVAVQIQIHVIHLLCAAQVAVDHVVVLIKGVLGHLQAGLAQQRRAEGAGVNHENLVYAEGSGLAPGEHPVLGQGVGEIDGAIALAVGVLIIVIGDKKIHAAPAVHRLQRV